mgnify:CR=1 FL=1
MLPATPTRRASAVYGAGDGELQARERAGARRAREAAIVRDAIGQLAGGQSWRKAERGRWTSILRPSLIDQLVLRGVAVGYEVDSSCRGARFQDLALQLSPQRVDIRRDRSLERDPG